MLKELVIIGGVLAVVYIIVNATPTAQDGNSQFFSSRGFPDGHQNKHSNYGKGANSSVF